jgi:hypothetical protein
MRFPKLATLASLAFVAAVSGACTTIQGFRPASPFARLSSAPVAAAAPSSESSVRTLRPMGASRSVNGYVNARRDGLDLCRSQERMHTPGFDGTATLEVTLAEDGYVLRARVLESKWTHGGGPIEDCLLTTVRRWRFPQSDTMDQYVHTFDVKFRK